MDSSIRYTSGLDYSQQEFNKKCRRISIKHMPQGISNQEILDLLKPYHYQQIHIDKTSQSCKAILLDGESASRCITDLHTKNFRGSQLSVSLASCDFMLCITQLPQFFTHDEFLTLITPFGTPERCFLVHSERHGHSKGYGCVEFTSKESSIKAKNHLNGKTTGDHTLQVHWLDTIPSTYSGLHSCCLLIENIPGDFKDSLILRDIFAAENVSPSFCQIANCPDDFAVVEFQNSTLAELSWSRLNNYKIGNNSLRVSFCVPGPCGLVILNSMKASRDLKRNNPNGGLLPTPVMEISAAKNPGTTQFGMLESHSANSLVNVNGALAHDDPEVQRLLKALHVRLQHVPGNIELKSHSGPGQPAANETYHKHTQIGKYPANMNHLYPTVANHFLPMQTIRGRSASYDSGVQMQTLDNEVFSSSNSSQEDVTQLMEVSDQYNALPQNVSWKPNGLNTSDNHQLKYDFACHPMMPRNNKMDPMQPWNYQHRNMGGVTICQREELQRSDSADSAYGGSQESTSSVSDHNTPVVNGLQHHTNSFNGSSNHPTSIFSSFQVQNGVVNETPKLIPSIISSHQDRLSAASNENTTLRSYPAQQPPQNYMVSRLQTQYPMRTLSNTNTTSVPLERNSTNFLNHHSSFSDFKRYDICEQFSGSSKIVGGNGIPRPDFLFGHFGESCNKSLSLHSNDKDSKSGPIFTSKFSFVSEFQNKAKFTGDQVIASESKCNVTPSSSAFLQHRSHLCTTPVQELNTPRAKRKTNIGNAGFPCIAAELHGIGADSPTQLQLLGSSLIEGLLGDSPRSTSDSTSESLNGSSGTGRLIRALNLFSPTECLTSPHTPNGRKRSFGRGMLPSPEPSPEAGAYVGQHSQGLGGHYAGAFAANLLCHKRRRSNDT